MKTQQKGHVVFFEKCWFLLAQSMLFKEKNNSYFSWGSSQITPYGGCHIMDHLGNLVHLVFPCFVVVVFVFKQGFGT